MRIGCWSFAKYLVRSRLADLAWQDLDLLQLMLVATAAPIVARIAILGLGPGATDVDLLGLTGLVPKKVAKKADAFNGKCSRSPDIHSNFLWPRKMLQLNTQK